VRLLRAKVSVCCINASGVVCSNLDVRGASCLASSLAQAIFAHNFCSQFLHFGIVSLLPGQS